MRLSFLRKIFLWSAAIFGGFYLLTIVYLMVNEENMIFFPNKTMTTTPADSGWQYRDINIDVGDGIQLSGWEINGSVPGDSLPVILFFHGNAGNISSNISALSVLRSIAPKIYAFDYQGYGNSGGKTNGQTFEKDCRAMLQYLLENEQIPISRILVYGHSLGSFGAASLADRFPELAGLVMEAAFTSVPDRAGEIYKILPIHMIMSVKMDNLQLMPRINIPVLFISSKEDRIIPLNHNQTLYEAANSPKLFLQLEKGRHDTALSLNRKLIAKKYLDFFSKPN